MIDTEQAVEVDGRPQRTAASPREDRLTARRHIHVAAVDKLHLTIDGRSLCGLLAVDERDVYSDQVALRVWNAGPLEQCAQCATALLTRVRRPGRSPKVTP